jgi:hypothetical protein
MQKVLIVANWPMTALPYETNLRFFFIAARMRNKFAFRVALFPNSVYVVGI